jgi:hypothetical protein
MPTGRKKIKPKARKTKCSFSSFKRNSIPAYTLGDPNGETSEK